MHSRGRTTDPYKSTQNGTRTQTVLPPPGTPVRGREWGTLAQFRHMGGIKGCPCLHRLSFQKVKIVCTRADLMHLRQGQERKNQSKAARGQQEEPN